MGRSGTNRTIWPLPRPSSAHLLAGLSYLLDLVSVGRDAPLVAVVFLALGTAVLFHAPAPRARAGYRAPFWKEVEDVRSLRR
jgi:hypothetical protein